MSAYDDGAEENGLSGVLDTQEQQTKWFSFNTNLLLLF